MTTPIATFGVTVARWFINRTNDANFRAEALNFFYISMALLLPRLLTEGNRNCFSGIVSIVDVDSKKESPPIDKIPIEIVAKVFSFLEIQDQQNCLIVCKKWNRYGKNKTFCSIADMYKTWKSHKMVLHLLKKKSEFRNLERNLIIHQVKQSFFTSLKFNAIPILMALGAIGYWKYRNVQNNALSQLSSEEKQTLVENYNKAPVCTAVSNNRPVCRSRGLSEMVPGKLQEDF